MEKLNIKNILINENFHKHTFYDEMREKFLNSNIDGDKPNILCIIAGCSGSGKTYFEKQLVNQYPEYFNKLPQITTRECRGKDDNGYYFVNKNIYNYMRDVLIARLDSFNGKQYGTLPVFAKDKINTVIASYDAIDDIFNLIEREELFIIPIMLLFDISEDNLTKDGKRTDRDSSFLEKERTELFNTFEKYKSRCIYSKIYKYEDYGRFAEISDIIEF